MQHAPFGSDEVPISLALFSSVTCPSGRDPLFRAAPGGVSSADVRFVVASNGDSVMCPLRLAAPEGPRLDRRWATFLSLVEKSVLEYAPGLPAFLHFEEETLLAPF